MTKRKWLIEKRESKGLSREQAAKLCNRGGENGKVSEKLVTMLEMDDTCVTHPNIVKRIAKVYGLDRKERTQLLPPNHRPGPDYDPDRYKTSTDYRFFVASEER